MNITKIDVSLNTIMTSLLNKMLNRVPFNENRRHLPIRATVVGICEHTRRIVFCDAENPERLFQLQQVQGDEVVNGFGVTKHPAGHHSEQWAYLTEAKTEAQCLRQLVSEVDVHLSRTTVTTTANKRNSATFIPTHVAIPVGKDMTVRMNELFHSCPLPKTTTRLNEVKLWMSNALTQQYGRRFSVELTSEGNWNAIPVLDKPVR